MGQFDSEAVDRLVSNLETGEKDFAAKIVAATEAAAAAAQAQSELATAQATNRAAVAAIKDYFANLDESGNPPDAPPTDLPPQPRPLPAPTSLNASAGSASVSLTWDAVPGATSYSVRRGESSGGQADAPIATGIGTPAYADSTVTPGRTYFYTVTASAAAAGDSPASPEASATPS